MRFLFVINPASGNKKKKKIVKCIYKFLPIEDFNIIYWKNSQQDIEYYIKKNLKDFDIIVAVGGDGTVNAVAQTLINTKTTLAIIPCGSGNGLARHLGIPLNIRKAIKGLSTGKIIAIDTCTVNNINFLSTCGIGFDAHVSSIFANSLNRGLLSYVMIVLKHFWKYKPDEYELIVNEIPTYKKALLITIANSDQYGNNAIIAPEANIQDGKINISIVKPFPFYSSFGVVIKLFNRSIHHSKYVETIQTESVTLIRSKPDIMQYDGESVNMGKKLNIRVIPKSLKVLVPQN